MVKKLRFILVENFNANGNDCKKVKFNEPLKLSRMIKELMFH